MNFSTVSEVFRRCYNLDYMLGHVTHADYYPGKKFSLPLTGSGSIAPLWRRFLALTIDWSLPVLASIAFFQYDSVAILLMFIVSRIVFQILIGMSIGQLLLGIRLSRVDGQRLGILAPIVRTLLICLVIPMVILDPDQRGLHDVAARTVVVRR